MRWLIVSVGVLIALAALTAVLGYFIPPMRIAARSVVLPVGRPRVWKTLVAMTDYPRWRRDVRAVEMLPAADGRPAWRERSRHGVILCRTEEITPPRRLVVHVTDRTLTYAATWTYELASEDDGTRVTITERAEIMHPIFRGLARYRLGKARHLDGYLAALGQEVSTGQFLPLDSRPERA